MGKVKGPQNPLAVAVNESKLIRSGAHPEFEKPTPLDNVVSTVKRVGTFVSGIGTRMNSTGSHRSPTTVHDKGAPTPKPAAADTMTDAERERIARKYVDR